MRREIWIPFSSLWEFVISQRKSCNLGVELAFFFFFLCRVCFTRSFTTCFLFLSAVRLWLIAGSEEYGIHEPFSFFFFTACNFRLFLQFSLLSFPRGAHAGALLRITGLGGDVKNLGLCGDDGFVFFTSDNSSCCLFLWDSTCTGRQLRILEPRISFYGSLISAIDIGRHLHVIKTTITACTLEISSFRVF